MMRNSGDKRGDERGGVCGAGVGRRVARFWAFGLAAALAIVSGCQTQRPVGLLQRDGEQAMLRGEPQEAIGYYQEWVDRQPQRADAQHALGEALLEAGRPSEAVGPLTVAWDHDQDNEEYFDDMAAAMRAAGRDQTLIGTLQTNATEKGRLVDYMRLGRNLQAMGLMDEAHQALKTAADIDAGRTVEPQLAFADFYRQLDRPQEEIRRLRMAYAIDPTDERVLARIHALDMIPGPSLALPPEERP